ncbi:MAG TPA: transcription-repair coupling factor [Gammaproteobacteria bacterium]|nr:transcription-repair coupling factor [Gammaproteobacteria bacterium]
MSRIATQPESLDAPVASPLDPPLPRAGRRLTWARLYGDSLALAIAGAARRHAGPLLVVTADSQAAEQLQEQLTFFAASAGLPVFCFPDWETLPYDSFSPHPDIVSERLEALHRLPAMQHGIVLVPVATLLQRLPPRSYLDAHSLMLDTGDSLDLDAMRRRLEKAGYRCVSEVVEHGEYAVRGSLLDLYPMGSELPYRIDLFDDEIESIRSFDPDSQRSLDTVEQVRLLPAREFPLDQDAIARFRHAWRASFEGDPQRSPIYRDVSNGLAPAGVEYYLPLFFEQTATLGDYLPEDCLVVESEDSRAAADTFREQIEARYQSLRHDGERPLLEPDRLYLNEGDLAHQFDACARVLAQRPELIETGPEAVNFATGHLPALAVQARAERPAGALQDFLAGFDGRVLITAESAGRRETLDDQLRGFGLRPHRFDSWAAFLAGDAPLGLMAAPIEAGLLLETAPRIAVVTENLLFGERAAQRRRRKPRRDTEAIVRNLTDLSIGAPVVHEDHGVGRYLGLQKLDIGGADTEFLTLEYAGGDKLYVPVSSLHLISRYTGASPDAAPLHKLGSDQWQKARRRAAERVRDVAAELLDIYARRAARQGHAFTLHEEEYRAFASAFPFEETPDQAQAIEAVLEDMASPRPMDRVVCGDVGFGKTEVAMRAAFVAVQGGRQVMVLVPTTLLAQQHYQNFCDRFADWPVRIEVMSRFRSKKQQQVIAGQFADGTLDILIGTHKILSDDIQPKNLGLVIIDEEHRFGVRQKEKLKALRAEVDLLTLTATPIPRTLNMSLSGLRDLSIIATPPAQRLAIKTFISEWNPTVIRDACLREIKRGGQVYFLHNEVETIDRMARELHELVPEAGIGIGHGQMRERELEQVMLDFYHRRFNLLLCTTIIESGIDVPTANTMIINRADKLGLAQLHQLRGRVGRSHHRAYAYLVVPPRKAMTADAIKRIEAIESLEDLGAGFTLATHDLEIRGAGELLGDEQSGQIHEIGFSLYTELLERAVAALKAGRQPELDRPLHQGPEIDLHMPALIPDDYLPDVHTRLILYKRIAGAADAHALRELQVEMIDRFGLLPQPLKNLFAVTGLKLMAAPMDIRKIDVGDSGGRLVFGDEPKVDPAVIVELIQREPQTYSLEGAQKFRFRLPTPADETRIETVRALLERLRGTAQ